MFSKMQGHREQIKDFSLWKIIHLKIKQPLSLGEAVESVKKPIDNSCKRGLGKNCE
jgi:hypothetical protein